MQYAKVGSDVYTDDYVVTLSTCTSDESVRFVVQARWVGTYK